MKLQDLKEDVTNFPSRVRHGLMGPHKAEAQKIVKAIGQKHLNDLESILKGDSDLYHDHRDMYQRLFDLLHSHMPLDVASGDQGGAEEWIADYIDDVFHS